MKLFIISPFKPFRGGIAQFSDELFVRLKQTLFVVKINYKRLYPSFLFPGTSQFVDGYNKNSKELNDGIDSLNPFSTLKLLKKIKKDKEKKVILSVYWMSFFSPILSFIAYFTPRETKKVALIHNLISHESRFYESFLIKMFVKQQDAFVVLSEKVKNDVVKINSKAKVLTLFHPLYTHFGDKIEKGLAREKMNIPSDKKVLLFFGLVRDYKGVDVLLKSLAVLDESYVLIIAGECYGSFEKYQKLIEENHLSERIFHFDRFISDDEVPILFSLCDLCVLPYKTATQSGVTATALHFNIPIISTNVGGLSEYVLDGKTGFLVEPNNPNLFANAISVCFKENLLFDFETNINEFKTSLSWDTFREKIVSFLELV
jgi:glycosyltransferase involved in cell wall biosynthesis